MSHIDTIIQKYLAIQCVILLTACLLNSNSGCQKLVATKQYWLYHSILISIGLSKYWYFPQINHSFKYWKEVAFKWAPYHENRFEKWPQRFQKLVFAKCKSIFDFDTYKAGTLFYDLNGKKIDYWTGFGH